MKPWHLIVVGVICGLFVGGYIDVMLGHRFAWAICAVIGTLIAVIGELNLRRKHPPNHQDKK
jgi:hypothetical protein